jgi:sodium pump decarboxylase gamma subunit
MTQTLLAVVVALVCMVSMAACGSNVELSAVDETTQSYMEEQMDSLLATLSSLTAEELQQYESVDDTFTVAAVVNYEDVMDELGAYVGLTSTEVEVDDKEYTVTSVAQYEKRNCTVTLVLDLVSSSYSAQSITFDAEYSLGETLEKAALNTVMGVGIVFCVLLFLCFLISMFKYIGKAVGGEKKEEKKAPAAPAPVAAEAAVETDDLELVAVIAAAIAAAENTSTDSFVVRSIKKVNKSKWRNA